ncbi:hypothetical protein MKW94_002004 [Papaver nudicaule]|uniref:Uncharacterized protein n=1 Tax=Papaver nudicaule TaxID=74823 RepID=A0AA41UZA0_PAPNU|nr:hypothetical protein [Papaver nudicaule]
MASSSDPRNHPTNPSPKTLTPSPHPTATPPLNPTPAVLRPQSHPIMHPKPSNLPRMQDPNPQFLPKVIVGPAISVRGYTPRPPQQFVSGGGGFQARPVLPYPHNHQVRGYGFDPHQQQVHMMRPPSLQPSQPGYRQNSAGLLKHIPSAGIHQKPATLSLRTPDFDGLKRDKSRDDKFVTINNRKIRLADGASLYALCRSWVHNGLPQESQSQIVGGMKPLPRPKPSASGNTNLHKRNEYGYGDEEKEEDEASVAHLSSHDLLQKHIKRAKRVRARLREERKQRIDRYKERLVHLLPSPVEEFRHDTAPGG